MAFLTRYVTTLVIFSAMKALIISSAFATPIVFPEWEEPSTVFGWEPDFKKVSGADFIADALSNIGEIFKLIGENVIALFQLIMESVLFVSAWVVFIFSNALAPIEGAPTIINILLITPFSAAVATMILQLLTGRKADA